MALNYMLFSGEETGLLRLYSTYRHDLKIYSSDEGRVEVSLVSKDSSMLDVLDTASIEMEAAKPKYFKTVKQPRKLIIEPATFFIRPDINSTNNRVFIKSKPTYVQVIVFTGSTTGPNLI
ncbi:hypothetical protein YC2023_107010 [Brassica napus]